MQDATNGFQPKGIARQHHREVFVMGFDRTLLPKLASYGLMLGNSAEGAVAYYAMRWGYLKVLPTLDAAHVFLMQIGGVR